MSAYNLANAVWRKSSRSNGDGNVCVEVAFVHEAASMPDPASKSSVAMRDSKNPAGGTLVVPATGWSPVRFAAVESGRHSG